jgi:ubiquinone/menaquinone biosynthesis C-methylase UbiE
MSNKYIKNDCWVNDILVDPLSKDSLTLSKDKKKLTSNYGKEYPVVNGVFDLRLLKTQTTQDQKIWRSGQDEFEMDSASFLIEDNIDYKLELESISKVYQEIPVNGRCLDVGGNKGTLRNFLNCKQEYITCDPFLKVFDGLEKRAGLLKTYNCLEDPVNFICCDAEYLPFKSSSFDTVHMRSVIDHFLNPESALLEAYRVLKKDGSLIVGLFVHGGKEGKESFIEELKEFIRHILPIIGVHKYTDHHIWHPTFKELNELIVNCGFKVSKIYWQYDSVCYIEAKK